MQTETLKELIREKDLTIKSVNEENADLRRKLKAEKLKNKKPWICIKEHPPTPGTEILAKLDYTKWGHGKSVRQSSVRFSEFEISYGGPHALTGAGKLKGLYFSIPAILHPEVVTHYINLPEID